MTNIEHFFRWLFTLSLGSIVAVTVMFVLLVVSIVCIVGALVQGAWRRIRS